MMTKNPNRANTPERDIWDRLEARRKELEKKHGRDRFSMEAVSKAIGKSPTYYSTLRRKGSMPHTDAIRKLASVLNMSTSKIYGSSTLSRRAEIDDLLDDANHQDLERVFDVLSALLK